MKFIISFLLLLLLASCGTGNNELNTTQVSSGNVIESNQNNSTGGLSEVDKKYNKIENGYRFLIKNEKIDVLPIKHSTLVVEWDDEVIYIDPVEPIETYSNYHTPTMIMITHEHPDHFNLNIIKAFVKEGVELLVNPGVYEKLSPELKEIAKVLKNSESINLEGFNITAIPAYNIREEALNYHPKGRDNGYIIEKNLAKVYISGDTEDTNEMRELKDIDIAFVSMNLPYTMPLESAIEGTIAFAPKNIFPYHYKSEEQDTDIEKFKIEVENKNKDINVILHNWYNEEK